MSKRKISLVLFNAVAFFSFVLIYPKPINAFFALGTLAILSQTVGPLILGFIALVIANIVLVLKKTPFKVYLGFGVVFSIIFLVLFHKTYVRFQALQTINQIGAELDVVNIKEYQELQSSVEFSEEPDNSWQNLLTKVTNSDEKYISEKIVKEDGSYCYNRSSFYISNLSDNEIENIIEDDSYKKIDVSCPNITVKNGTKACGLAWDIFTHFDDEEKIADLLSEFNITKKDPIMMLCEYGVTSSHIAFILRHHGYLVYYGGLIDLNTDFLDIEDPEAVEDFRIFIDIHSNNPREKYLYFVVNRRDLDTFYDTNPDNHKDYLNQFSIINTTGLDLSLPEDQIIKPYVINENEVSKLNFDDYKIVCKNKLHCFLTRHYLLYSNNTDVNKLHCINCHKERVQNYCEN